MAPVGCWGVYPRVELSERRGPFLGSRYDFWKSESDLVFLLEVRLEGPPFPELFFRVLPLPFPLPRPRPLEDILIPAT